LPRSISESGLQGGVIQRAHIHRSCKRLDNVIQQHEMDHLQLLKSRVEEIRTFIKGRLGENTVPEAIGVALFDIWKEDLVGGKVSKGSGGAFVSARPQSLQQLEEKSKTGKNSIKPAITHVREALQSGVIEVAGYLLSLDITKHRYSLSVTITPDPLATLRLIWKPYLGGESVFVASVKRVFFKINKDVYVRNVTVDNESDWKECDTLRKLIGHGDAHAVRLYAPSGEMSAAFALLDLFSNQLKLSAVGKLIAPHYKHDGQNLVVLGSGIEEPHFVPPPELGFSFKNFDSGVEYLKNASKFTDKVTDPHLKVHVVVQRWQKNDGKVITVIYGSHAAAIEEVVRNLVSEGPASRLINKPRHIRNWLKKRIEFECLFAVDLDRDGTYFIPRSISLVRRSRQSAQSPSPSRNPQHSFKKGA
jgi:hypothetical protein